NVAENTYVRRDGVWMIQAMHVFTNLATDYDQGWGRSALPAPVASNVLPPDRPPTVVYENYPRTFNPVPYFARVPDAAPAPAPESGSLPSRRQLDAAARQVQRVMDSN